MTVQVYQSQPLAQQRNLQWWTLRILMLGLALVFIFGLGTLAAGALAKTKLARQHPAPGQLIDMGGYKLHLNCVGQGAPTVVMDAGLLDFSIVWARVQPEVATFTRVCVYDRAGLGWSEASPYPRSSEVMAKELHTLLDNANVAGPYLLVGHSFGGANARLFAHHFPDEVMGMVLVDAAHEEQTLRIQTLQEAAEQTRQQFRTLASLSCLGLLALMPENIPNRGFPDEALAQYRAVLATTPYFEMAIKEAEGLEQSFAELRAANITSIGDMPLMVLSRGQSEAVPGLSDEDHQQLEQAWQDMQSKLVALSSNSQQIIAQESGHYIQLEQPELVVEAVREMVQEARR